MFQTKTYDSVTDKFMDFSFEKVKMISKLFFLKISFCFSFPRMVQKVINDVLIEFADTQCLHALL